MIPEKEMETIEKAEARVGTQPALEEAAQHMNTQRFRVFSTARAIFIGCQLLILGISLLYFASPDGATRVWDALGELDPFYLLKGAILITTFVAPAVAIYIGLSYIPNTAFRYFVMAVFTVMAGFMYAGNPEAALGMVSSLFKTSLFILVLSLFFKGGHLWRTTIYIAPILFFFCGRAELAYLVSYFNAGDWFAFMQIFNASVGDVFLGLCLSFALSKITAAAPQRTHLPMSGTPSGPHLKTVQI